MGASLIEGAAAGGCQDGMVLWAWRYRGCGRGAPIEADRWLDRLQLRMCRV